MFPQQWLKSACWTVCTGCDLVKINAELLVVFGFDPHQVWQCSFWKIDHEIFSVVILSLLLIQEGTVVSFW